MRWHNDKTGAEWTATIVGSGTIRVLRRTVAPPYREGDSPREGYETFEFELEDAAEFADTLAAAVKAVVGE